MRFAFALAAALLIQTSSRSPSAADGFAFFRPAVEVSEEDRRQLDAGGSIARVVRSEGREAAVFAAVSVRADADRLMAWMRRIEALKRSSYVTEIGRFSDPPRLSDLSALTLPDRDVDDTRECRPDHCAIKLSAAEMRELAAAGRASGDWRRAMQDAFRRLVLARVQTYLAGGHKAFAPYADGGSSSDLGAAAASILQHTPSLASAMPAMAACLADGRCRAEDGVESFVYWSQEQFGGKPVVIATHVVMARGTGLGTPDVLVAGKQIFATHYMNGSLGLTALVRGDGDRRYLAYLNRSHVDVLGGFFGGLVRLVLERRLASEAPEILQGLKRRLEGGNPPPPAG